MDRDFREGQIAVDFPLEAFVRPGRMLVRSIRLFLATWRFLAWTTLVIFLPGKLLLQFFCYVLDVPTSGILSYFLLELSDLVLGALAIPAVVYGLIGRFRKGSIPPLGECLRWGRRQWGKTLWNKVKVEITVMLWGALLVIPGILAMLRLAFVDIVVAIEADAASDPLERSRELSLHQRWRIFLVLAPMAVLDMAANFLILDRVPGAVDSRVLFALADCVLACAGQLGTVAVLLMYLGLIPPPEPTPVRKPRTATGPRAR